MPRTVKKAVRELIRAEKVAEERAVYGSTNATARLKTDAETMSLGQVEEVIRQLEKEMKEAARPELRVRHRNPRRDQRTA